MFHHSPLASAGRFLRDVSGLKMMICIVVPVCLTPHGARLPYLRVPTPPCGQHWHADKNSQTSRQDEKDVRQDCGADKRAERAYALP